jgi:hypothetical protein
MKLFSIIDKKQVGGLPPPWWLHRQHYAAGCCSSDRSNPALWAALVAEV